MGPKGSFPLITFSDLDEVIRMLQINFHIDAGFLRGVQQVGDQWKRIPILLSDLVETSEVNAESEGAIPFFDK